MCIGAEFWLLAAAVTSAAGTAVSVSQANVAAKSQKSAAEQAGRIQEQAFAASQQAFTQQILPAIPQPEVIKEQAKAEAVRRKKLQALTILTSPAGLIGEPNIVRKTLLGQ